MAFKLIIKPIVFLDVDDAISYYNQQSQGLGKRFYDNFIIALQNIQTQPYNYIFIYQLVRRSVVKKFLYKVFYQVSEENILVLGVAHAKRSNIFIHKRLRL